MKASKNKRESFMAFYKQKSHELYEQAHKKGLRGKEAKRYHDKVMKAIFGNQKKTNKRIRKMNRKSNKASQIQLKKQEEVKEIDEKKFEEAQRTNRIIAYESKLKGDDHLCQHTEDQWRELELLCQINRTGKPSIF